MKYLILLTAVFIAFFAEMRARDENSDYKNMQVFERYFKIPDDINLDNAQSDLYFKVTKDSNHVVSNIQILKGKPKLIEPALKQIIESKLTDSIFQNEKEYLIHISIYDLRKGKNKFDDSGDSLYVSQAELLETIKKDACVQIDHKIGNKVAKQYEKIPKYECDYREWYTESKEMNLNALNFKVELPSKVEYLLHIEYRGETASDYDWIIYSDSTIICNKIEYSFPDTIYRQRKMNKSNSWRLLKYDEDQDNFFYFFKNVPVVVDSSLIPKNSVSYRVIYYENGKGREYKIASPCTIAENTEMRYYESLCRYLTAFKEYFQFND